MSNEAQTEIELGSVEAHGAPASNSKPAVDEKSSKEQDKLLLESNDFAGLTKEQLAQFANDPYWRKVRIILFALFWFVWFLLLVIAIAVVILTPKCPPRPALDTYQKGVAYKVLPTSFADNDGNGVGDLEGLIRKLSYIQSTGVNTIIIGPVNQAVDDSQALYDTVSYLDIHRSIGDWNKLKELIREANKRGLQVFVELNLNMVSEKYTNESDQLVAVDQVPANCALRMRQGYKAAWEVKQSKAFYTSFASGFVELNLTVESVRKAAAAAVDKLLDYDVDGIVLKDASFYFEDLTNCASEVDSPSLSFWSVDHKVTMNQEKNLEIVQLVSDRVREYNAIKTFKKRVVIVEAELPKSESTVTAYGKFADRGAAAIVVDTFAHIVRDELQSNTIQKRLTTMFSNNANKWWPLWQFSTPEYGRIATRFGANNLKCFLALGVLLPGTFVNYYGDELGMKDRKGPSALSDLDSNFFLPEYRSPMQWSLSDDVANVEVQQASGYAPEKSIYRFFQALAKVKTTYESLMWGQFTPLNTTLLAPANNDLVAFVRAAEGFKPVVIVINFGDSELFVKLSKALELSPTSQYTYAVVAFSSYAALEQGSEVVLETCYGLALTNWPSWHCSEPVHRFLMNAT